MRFKSRTLLRVISILVGTLVLGLIVLIVVLALLRQDSVHAAVGVAASIALLIPAAIIVKMVSDSFSTLEVDESGVRYRKLVGSVGVRWEQISRVRYVEFAQHVHGSTAQEYLIELLRADGKRLLRLKSTFEKGAYSYVMMQAKSRSIPVETA